MVKDMAAIGYLVVMEEDAKALDVSASFTKQGYVRAGETVSVVYNRKRPIVEILTVGIFLDSGSNFVIAKKGR